MADSSYPPHSETLAPPRKSVELVDPGAHELGNNTPILHNHFHTISKFLTDDFLQNLQRTRMTYSLTLPRAQSLSLVPIPLFPPQELKKSVSPTFEIVSR